MSKYHKIQILILIRLMSGATTQLKLKLYVQYIYTGTITFEGVEPSTIFDLLVPSNKLENALITLLKRDDLQIEESKIWDKVIQWGKEQTPNLPADLEQWNDENFLALKITLEKCIPLIRYFQIPGRDIAIKVNPYRHILGSNLWNDITIKIMAPDISVSSTILPARKKIPAQLPVREVRFVNPSSIINDEHFAEISSWIDHRPSKYDITKIPYKFNLLLRGSRDGFTSEIFHRLCDNLPGTVVIIKINGTNEILGGYNPLVWTSNNPFKWFATTDSFIFLLKSQNLLNSVLSKIIYADNAIGCYSGRGPVFGNTFYMSNDNRLWNYYHNTVCYEKRLRSDDYNLLIDEFEVFQVLKD
ncbi:hypothetical protein C2G38_2140365 [Gigaspora rosea]|uniref:TLDc domain-containing protein n=1 Tax=Gigaspora rosea TaxID=44941 RepID=A0A397VHZ1_9GLOM|nr:hypothetical protein C2G38_2140365 [Gigaspora rosea]